MRIARLVPHRGGARQPRFRHTHVDRRRTTADRARARRGVLRPAGRRGRSAQGGRPPVLHRLARRPRRAACGRTARPSPSCSAGRPQRGVVVKGLMWRSHLDALQYSEDGEPPPRRGDRGGRRRGAAGPAGAPRRLAPPEDGRAAPPARTGAATSRSPAASTCATAGATTTRHRGDPQAVRMTRGTATRPPWHDVQLTLRGPVVRALDTTFRERWHDPMPLDSENPMAYLRDRLRARRPDAPTRCPTSRPAPPPGRPTPRPGAAHLSGGPAAVLVRARRGAHRRPRVHQGDPPRPPTRSTWRTSTSGRPRWPACSPRALRDQPDLHLVAVVPRHPDIDGRLALPPNMVGREMALRLCRKAGARPGARLRRGEPRVGTPVYVHAKVCVVDDVWASVGSDNFNRRSWTHDSELSCAVLDETRDERAAARPRRARRRRPGLRPRPAAAAVARAPRPRRDGDDEDLVDPATAVPRDRCPPRRAGGLAPRRAERAAAARSAAPARPGAARAG